MEDDDDDDDCDSGVAVGDEEDAEAELPVVLVAVIGPAGSLPLLHTVPWARLCLSLSLLAVLISSV